MKDIPIFIIFRDLISPMRDLIQWLEKAGHENIHIIDNKSTFLPAKQFLDGTSHTVHRLNTNVGHRAPWNSKIIQKVCGKNSRYIVTDADIVPQSGCPLDAVQYMSDLLSKHYEEDIIKVGFGLDIFNLPQSYTLRDKVYQWEKQFWKHEIEPNVYKAPIDTTFALYKPLSEAPKMVSGVNVKKDALRTGKPYLADHTPWLWDTHNLTHEQKYYVKNAKTPTHWTYELRKRK